MMIYNNNPTREELWDEIRNNFLSDLTKWRGAC
jgi:hypothetical protein